MPDDRYDPGDELAELFPQPLQVQIGRRTFAVRALGLREFVPISRALRVAWAALADDAKADAYVAEHIAELVPLIAAAIDRPAGFVEKLPGGAALRLFAAALEVNQDFFVQCFAVRSGATAKLSMQILVGAGLAPSTTSETAAIPIATATPPDASIAS